MKIRQLAAFADCSLDRAVDHPYLCYGGGGKTPTVQTIAADPTPAPPAEEATLEEFADPTVEAEKRKARTQGATSLQIPLVGSSSDSGTVGTV